MKKKTKGTSTGATKTSNTDPRLKKAEEEIAKVLDKHGVGAAVALVSDSHAQFLIKFPKWSLIKFDGENLQLRTDHKNPELTNQSAHTLFAMRDMLAMQFAGLSDAADAFTSAIEAKGGSIDHEPFAGMLDEG